jgi:hypothetical protein
MKSSDRFLAGIVAGVLALLILSFGIAFLRPPPGYQPEDTPEGVVHNYLLAIKEKDYATAYGYLSPSLPGYPQTQADFTRQVINNSWSFGGDRSSTFEIVSSRVTGASAFIEVSELIFRSGGLLSSSEYSNVINFDLVQTNGAWKINHASSYWHYCWERVDC